MGKSQAGYDDIVIKLQETMDNMDNARKRLEKAELEQGETSRKLLLVEEENKKVQERLQEKS